MQRNATTEQLLGGGHVVVRGSVESQRASSDGAVGAVVRGGAEDGALGRGEGAHIGLESSDRRVGAVHRAASGDGHVSSAAQPRSTQSITDRQQLALGALANLDDDAWRQQAEARRQEEAEWRSRREEWMRERREARQQHSTRSEELDSASAVRARQEERSFRALEDVVLFHILCCCRTGELVFVACVCVVCVRVCGRALWRSIDVAKMTSPAIRKMAAKLGPEFTASRNKKAVVYTWDVDFCLKELLKEPTQTFRAVVAAGMIATLAMTGRRWCSLVSDPNRSRAAGLWTRQLGVERLSRRASSTGYACDEHGHIKRDCPNESASKPAGHGNRSGGKGGSAHKATTMTAQTSS